MSSARPTPMPGAKMVYLIKRKPTTTREELIAHWFANHMVGVIDRNERQRAAGKPHAKHYVATLFDPPPEKPSNWDGMAHLWYSAPLPRPEVASAVEPYDTFQEKVEPYWPWANREYIVLDGALPLAPLTLNPPFPCTRSGFFKVTFLVALQEGADRDALFDHWLDVHVPNVRTTLEKVGGFRYVVSHSMEPETEPYAGMAELYFSDASAWAAYQKHIRPDGMEQWVDYDAMAIFHSGTEMVGIE
ncbi:MAG: hypothetical protein CBE16_12780 [Rhodospirillaceae bacterium TMED256]|nr:MAG: hypothetical protein CBE16_12780 [Rhodospirillaceae bacterium TMED256]